MPESRKLGIEAAARLVRPRDSVLCGFVAGQPVGFLEALGARTDLVDVVLHTGLLSRPYALLKNPGVRVVSGFFGPIERMARASGARVSYLPADFSGLEPDVIRQDGQRRSTPIIESRVTTATSSSSVRSSVPGGRCGNTRYRTSALESQTRISTSS